MGTGPAAEHDNDLGRRLRTLRLARGMRVRELARRLGMSPSAISQIETGKIQPSVRTLYAIAAELGVGMSEALFGEVAAALPEVVVQRSDRGSAITLGSGVRWRRLVTWTDHGTEFLEATYEPGGGRSADGTPARHGGLVFGLVLSGSLRVRVGLEELALYPGDAITVPSSTLRRVSNDGTSIARALWVVRPRGGSRPAEGCAR